MLKNRRAENTYSGLDGCRFPQYLLHPSGHIPGRYENLKIRTMENDLHIAAFNAMGAIATPMASGDVFTGLQQGTIDAAENAIANLIANRYYEITKNVTWTNHVLVIWACLCRTRHGIRYRMT